MSLTQSSSPVPAAPAAGAGIAEALRGRRVGIAAISLGGGGAERQAALWAEAAVHLGAEVRVLALESATRQYDLPAAASLEVVGKAGRTDAVRAVGRLRALAANSDVVAAFQPYMGMLCMLAGVRRSVIVTGQDPLHWQDTTRVPAPLFRAAFRAAASATAPSLGLIELHRQLNVRPRGDRWRHVPNIVAADAFRVPAPDRRGVLFVGRLVPEKRPLLALRAAVAAGQPITFLGEGPLHADLEAEARRLGAEELLTLHPFTPAPWELFARHRVLVLTSRYETFANVIVESLAAGTPVVSVDCDFGPREILAGATHSVLTGDGEADVAAALSAVASAAPVPEEAAECRRIAARYARAALEPAIAGALAEVAR